MNLNLAEVYEHQKDKSLSEFGDVIITSGEYKENRVVVHTKEFEEDMERIEGKLNYFVDVLEQIISKLK
ncbi:hypothetical protein [Alkalibaculum bacchi]|uniref:hypothetical protein n=1 Tax=Alkalibaculum bacchi TaxID=645887 RepID=UPI0026EC1CD0|nr:hypothetical protein [Alkalibaculum bacchi]